MRCSSNDQTAGVNWTFAENGTAVSLGLKAFGTSQGDGGVLRIYPANILSPSGTRFQCWDGENSQTLNVTLLLRKSNHSGCIILFLYLFLMFYHDSIEESLFFVNLHLENITDFSSLYDSCRGQVPDIPYAKVSIVNETNPASGRDYFYCRVETERGIFRSSSVLFQGEP